MPAWYPSAPQPTLPCLAPRLETAASTGLHAIQLDAASMPRPSRIELPGTPQHAIRRGDDWQPCFFSGADPLRYRSELRQIAAQGGCNMHATIMCAHRGAGNSACRQVWRARRSFGGARSFLSGARRRMWRTRRSFRGSRPSSAAWASAFHGCTPLFQPCMPLFQPCTPLFQPCSTLFQSCTPLFQPCTPLLQSCTALFQPCAALFQSCTPLWEGRRLKKDCPRKSRSLPGTAAAAGSQVRRNQGQSALKKGPE